MKRVILPGLVLLLAASAFAQTPEIESVIDFSMSTRDLVEIIRDQQYERIDPTKAYILSGSVASTLVLDSNPETYLALIELVDGEWIGLDSIEVYRMYVVLEGSRFSNRVLDRVPRDPGPEVILTNSKLLMIAQFRGEAEWEDGSFIPMVTALAIR